MEELFINRVSWGEFLTIAISLVGVYFLLHLFKRLVSGTALPYRYQEPLQHGIEYVLLVYEPLVLLILGVSFVLINPIYHGLLIGFIVVLGFPQWRAYFYGRIVQISGKLRRGKKFRAGKLSGIIYDINRFGVQIQNREGVHFVNYRKLLEEGYMLVGGERSGGFYNLRIQSDGEETLDRARVLDLVTSSPYLSWNHRIEPLLNEGEKGLDLRVSVREERHVGQLCALVEDAGYKCRVRP